MVAGRGVQIVEVPGGMNQQQLPVRAALDLRGELLGSVPAKYLLGLGVAEAPDHGAKVSSARVTRLRGRARIYWGARRERRAAAAGFVERTAARWLRRVSEIALQVGLI